jgi:hypothetical protein
MATLATLPKLDAAELRRLPASDRDRILEDVAVQAAAEYELNSDLTAFEAFGKDDLHGHSSSTRSR